MFCRNCGNKLEDGNVFCTQCGAAVMGRDAQPAKPQVTQAPPQEDFVLSSTAQQPAKKKSGKKWIAPVAILSAVAAVVVAVILCWPAITGLFSGGGLQASGNGGGNGGGSSTGETGGNPGSSQLSGIEHLNKVETESLGGYVDSISQAYGQLLQGNTGSYATDMNLTLRLGDDLLDMLERQITGGADGSLDLSWMSEVALDMDVSIKDSMEQMQIGLLLGGKRLVDLDVIMDMVGGTMWMGVPGLNGDYVEFDFADIGLSASQLQNYMAQTEDVQKMLPSEEVVNKLLKKYIGIALDCIQDAEKKTETVELDGTKQTVTVLTVKVTQEDLLNMGIAILEEAKNDQELKTIIDKYSAYANKLISQQGQYGYVDYYSAFSQGVTNAIAGLKSGLTDCEEGNYIQIISYVDSTDKIVGRAFGVASNGVLQELGHYLTVTQGKEFTFEAIFGGYEILGSGSVEDGMLNGSYNVRANGTHYLHVELRNIDQNMQAKGHFSGTIRLEPTNALMSQMGNSYMDIALELTIETAANGGGIDLDVLMNDVLLFGLTAETTMGNGGNIQKPSSNHTVDATSEEELIEWLNGVDYDKLLQNMRNAKVPTEIVDGLDALIDSMLDSINGVGGGGTVEYPAIDQMSVVA